MEPSGPVREEGRERQDPEETSAAVVGFRIAYVFDVSQTDGRKLPQIGIVHGDPREYRERLHSFADAGFQGSLS